MRRLAHEAGLCSAAASTLHSTRHTFATAALDAGVALRDVQAAQGLIEQIRRGQPRQAQEIAASPLLCSMSP